MLSIRVAGWWVAIGFLSGIGFWDTDCRADLPSGFGEPNGILSAEEIRDGWIALFDGQTMFGWRPQDQANWRIDNAALTADSGQPCLLCTTTQFSDYVLKLEFQSDPETNSGIFLRTSPQPRNVTDECYELNIAPPDNPFPTGSLVERIKVTPEVNDEWHSYEVTVLHDRVTVVLDGQPILEYQDPDPMGKGFIGLQYRSGRVAFRNLKLKPLGMYSLFNGKDLAGWKEYPAMESKFSVTPEGTISVRNGPGQLETEETFGDFVLQLEAISHGVALNSGIFIRCIPGEKMNGYESQLQNGHEPGDPTKPLDAGTGAIFRRTTARRVVSDDFEWLTKTIVANGPHIAVWVNGYQVTDWVDRRKPDTNPRRGLRTEPGTIMIQGHDPTTNLSFRDLQIAPIRSRR